MRKMVQIYKYTVVLTSTDHPLRHQLFEECRSQLVELKNPKLFHIFVFLFACYFVHVRRQKF